MHTRGVPGVDWSGMDYQAHCASKSEGSVECLAPECGPSTNATASPVIVHSIQAISHVIVASGRLFEPEQKGLVSSSNWTCERAGHLRHSEHMSNACLSRGCCCREHKHLLHEAVRLRFDVSGVPSIVRLPVRLA